MPDGVVMVLDEAAMCSTRSRLTATRRRQVEGKVVDVGDHRQIPSVDVGDGHYALVSRLGATVLGHNHRFRDPVYRDAAELLSDHQTAAAVQVLRARGAVSDRHARPADAWVAMVDDWLTDRDTGDDMLMLSTERAAVAELNHLARAHLIARGDIARRSRTYQAPNDHRTIALAVGDNVILVRKTSLGIDRKSEPWIPTRPGATARTTGIP